MLKKYPVAINKDPDSDWAVSFIGIPIHSMGSTLEQALAECQDGFETFMDGEEALPEPMSLEEAVLSDFARESLSVTLVEIDTAFWDDPTEPRTSSAKRSEWQAIDKAAKAFGKSRSAFMVAAALEKAASAR